MKRQLFIPGESTKTKASFRLSAPLSFSQAVFHGHLKSGEIGSMSQTLQRGYKDSRVRVDNGVTKNENLTNCVFMNLKRPAVGKCASTKLSCVRRTSFSVAQLTGVSAQV